MVFKFVSFGCGIKLSRLIGDRANLIVVQNPRGQFTEIPVQEILKWFQICQCSIDGDLISPFMNALLDHGFEFTDVYRSGDDNNCSVFVTP